MVKSLTELPIDNLSQILSKLPFKTIVTCRCVCKTLLDFISYNPYLAALHSSNATQNLIIQFHRKNDVNSPAHYIDVEQLGMVPCEKETLRASSCPIFEIPNDEKEFNNHDFHLVNACNGLIYFAVKFLEPYYSFICNPITSEYIRVPKIDRRVCNHCNTISDWTMSSCLGYSPISRKYKVLRIYYQCLVSLQGAHIHDVGSSTWRDVEDELLRSTRVYCYYSYAFLNGNGYWCCWNSIIISFDFESEVFRKIDAPHGLMEYDYDRLNIGVIEDCLYLINNSYKCEIWTMDECGQWNKKFTYREMPREIQNMKALIPLQKLGSGKILMVLDCHRLVCFDTKRNKFRVIDLHMEKPNFNVVSFVPSFVLLKDMMSLHLEEKLQICPHDTLM